MRRAAAIISAQPKSAVVSFSTSGVLVPSTPRALNAAHVEVVVADRHVRHHPQPRRGRRAPPHRPVARGAARRPCRRAGARVRRRASSVALVGVDVEILFEPFDHIGKDGARDQDLLHCFWVVRTSLALGQRKNSQRSKRRKAAAAPRTGPRQITEKTRHAHAARLGDRLHHEVRRIADVACSRP